MKSLCNTCNYSNITHILFHNVILNKCNKCNYCFLSINDYHTLVLNILQDYNIGNVNKYYDLNLLSFIDKKIINNFLKRFNNFKKITQLDNEKCIVCKDKLTLIKLNKNFSMYFCKNCFNIYFQKIELENYIQYCIKKLRFYYFIKKMNKRFLQIWSKNNVKK